MSSVSVSDTAEIGMKPADLRVLKTQLKKLPPSAGAGWLIMAIESALAFPGTHANKWLREQLEAFHAAHG